MQERGGAQAEVGGGAPGEGAPRRQRVGILVVDDEAGIRDVLVRAFGTHFDVVDAADSAEDAQVLMQRQ
ncbi:MAG: hypothetical protein WCK28_13580, partial [Burkholderiales bacterium]